MQIKSIITKRGYKTWPSWDLVFEWEDIFSEILRVPFFLENKFIQHRKLGKVPFLPKLLQTNMDAFTFEMTAIRNNVANNKRNIIPCIIDFFIRNEQDLKAFYFQYSNNDIVFVSSREAYEYLLSVNCPLNVRHLALSISDKYKIEKTTRFEKCYDLVMVGRQNPVLLKMVEQYASRHKSFRYVYRILNGGVFNYYTSDGQFLGDINTREKYMSLMRKARVGLYSTPGIDGGETRTNGFNQITPRFLELIACGCHVIARYPSNPDTDYYEINKFCPNIEDYLQFEKRLDYCLETEVNLDNYRHYLLKHYTSVRCKELQHAIS